MHQSFTGSTRRPRQVNLSGRQSNPWNSLSGSPKPNQGQAGTQNAIAQAQAERAKRALDRDKLNAARKVQRVWRGHATRQEQRRNWRKEWDAQEQARFHKPRPIQYGDPEIQELAHTPYSTEALLLSQLRLLTAFLNYKDETDRMRLTFFGDSLVSSLGGISSVDSRWNRYFAKLQRLVGFAIESTSHFAVHTNENRRLLRLGLFLSTQTSDPDYEAQFRSLCLALKEASDEPTVRLIGQYVVRLLESGNSSAYRAFLTELLRGDVSPILPTLREFFENRQFQTLLCDSAQREVTNLQSDIMLWILANMVWLWRAGSKGHQAIEWVQGISSVMGRCANTIAERIDILDQPMAGTDDANVSPLDPFVRAQISLLPQQDSVQTVMNQLRSQQASVSEVAKPLANYAVALLRSFPTRATNIRMWLYRNSPSGNTQGAKASTIQYLWKAVQCTRVFLKIRADPKHVLSVLTEAVPPSNQIGHLPPSPSEISSWQEDWRIVLLFLELYTFILKLMDDEEFFALNDTIVAVSNTSYQFRQGALPLNDIAALGSFLKNLAFSLYWNAADLAEFDNVDDAGGLAVLFGTAPNNVQRSTGKKTPRTLAGNDVSQTYLKGLATGLLRMLYERDSRRKFLPDDYWLMTSQFDLQGFIPAVVDEEERRHQTEDDADDEEIDNSLDLDSSETYDEQTDDLHIPSLGNLFGIRAPHTSRSQSSRFADQMAKQRDQARKRRQLQSLAPRLEILRNLPFFIPFDTRVQIFRRFVYRDQERRRNGFVEPDDWRMSVAATQGRDLSGRPRGMDIISRHHANIRRESVFGDAFANFYELGEALKEPIQISFIDKFGAPEAGIDGGGVTKEFLMSVTGEAFDPQTEMPLFEENEQRYIYPNPNALEQLKEALRQEGKDAGSEGFMHEMRTLLQHYEFVGRIVGKCMYEGILIDVNFAGFFLLKWALTGGTTTATHESAYRASINDLRDFDDQLYQGLLKLKNYAGDVEADFGLNFTATDTFEIDGQTFNKTTELLPNGSNISVNNTNRLRYIDRVTRYRLQERPRAITNAFLKGLGQIISPMWLAMFNQKELQKLVGGDNNELDIVDLRRNTQYGGLYVIGDDGLEHPTVAMFWKVLKDMSDGDRRKVLKFVTSTPRAPLLGFSHLNPRFSIRDSSEDQSRLPSTSTCVNLLKLPRYADENTMREKLLYAANSGAGFDLS